MKNVLTATLGFFVAIVSHAGADSLRQEQLDCFNEGKKLCKLDSSTQATAAFTGDGRVTKTLCARLPSMPPYTFDFGASQFVVTQEAGRASRTISDLYFDSQSSDVQRVCTNIQIFTTDNFGKGLLEGHFEFVFRLSAVR